MKRVSLTVAVLTGLLAVCLAAPLAAAHTTVKSATLEDGGIYQTMPETFDLVFAQKVGLAGFSITDADGHSVDIDYTPPKSMETNFSIALPQLGRGHYRVSWRAMAKDGHVLTGALSFTVR